MNYWKLEKILNEIIDTNDYNLFIKKLTFEERLCFLVEFSENEKIMEKVNLLGDLFFLSFFTEEESEKIYNSFYNTLTPLEQDIVLLNSNDELIMSHLSKSTSGINIALGLSNDLKKIEVIDKYEFSKLEKIKIITSLLDDNLKLKYLSNNEFDILEKAEILTSFKKDIEKLELIPKYILDNNFYNDALCIIFMSLNSDSLKIKQIEKYFKEDSYKARVITTLKNETLKLQYIEKIESIFDKIIIVYSLKDELLKLKYLALLDEISLINYINVSTIKTKLISDEVIDIYSKKYNVNKNNLALFVKKYGYEILKYIHNKNIQNVFQLDEENIKKYFALFSYDLLKEKDLNNIVFAILQREFRILNNSVIHIFPTLKRLVQEKNQEQFLTELQKIEEVISIDEFLKKYYLTKEQFIQFLFTSSFLPVLHDLTNDYIDKVRNRYVEKRWKEVKKELNLEESYSKNDLINELLFLPYEEIIDLIISIKPLTKEEIELIENKKLLIDVLTFKKNPKEYKKNNIDYVKKQIKKLNRIFNELYLQKKLHFLGQNETCQTIYKMKDVKKESLFQIMSELNVSILEKNVFSSGEVYDKLIHLLQQYQFITWSDTFSNLLFKCGIIFDESTTASLITYFTNIIENKKEISLMELLDEASVYDIESHKYKILLGMEDFKLISTNPKPNPSSLSKKERFEQILYYVKKMYERKYITIPPIKKEISVNNKKIIITVGDIRETKNLTYGERTTSCMRIGGAGATLFDFCLTNENGFHVGFYNENEELITRVSGFRNGNTIFLNELRDSLLKEYSTHEIVLALQEFSKTIINLSQNTSSPIENVVISNNHTIKNEEFSIVKLGVENIKQGYNDFYTDVGNEVVVLESTKQPFSPLVLDNNFLKYEILRNKIKIYTTPLEIKEAILRIQILEQILQDIPIDSVDMNIPFNLEEIKTLYVGEDWYIALDFDENIILEYCMLECSEKALEEMETVKKSFKNRHNKI